MIVLVLLALPALSLLFLQNRQVQTRLSKYLVEQLSQELQVPISLSSVNYSFFRRVQVRDLYIEDLHGDTLFYAGLTKLRIKQFRSESRGLSIRKITLEDAFVNLVIDTSGVVNITVITDRLKKPHVPPEMKSRVQVASIELLDSRFSLSRMGYGDRRTPVDFNDFHLKDLKINVEDLEVYRDTVRMELRSLSGIEQSGFDFREIRSRLSLSKHHLHFHNLGIQTPGSILNIPALTFDFREYSSFKRFSKEVDLFFTTRKSDLLIGDLFSFVPGGESLLDRISIDGMVSGKLSDLKGENLVLTYGNRSSLAFDFMMIGLPDIRKAYLDFHFRDLNTSMAAIQDLMGMTGDSSAASLYPWINLGGLDFTGQFTGYPDQFVASGLLATDMGRMVMDLSFEPDSLSGIGFHGQLQTRDFKLGKFLNQERDIDQLDMDVFTDGHLNKGRIRAQLRGTVDTLELFNYAYSNINLDGSFTNQTFEGGFSVSDPNIRLDFNGRADISGDVPVYRFTADVARIRPHFLNLPQSDPSYFASFLIETDLSGRSLDELNGELRLVNSLFEKNGAQVQLYNVTLKARNNPEASLLQLRSDLLDANITGQYRLSSLPLSFRNLADHYMNLVPNADPGLDTANYFVYQVDIKHVDPLLDFFLPFLEIGDRSKIAGTYDPGHADIRMTGEFPTVGVAGNTLYRVHTHTRSGPDMLEAGFTADSLTFGADYCLENQEVEFLASRDTAHVDVRWDNRSDPSFKGELSLHGTFQADSLRDRGFLIDLDPGLVSIRDTLWEVHPASLLLKKNYLDIRELRITGTDKWILADGVILADEGRDFQLDLQNLNLAQLSGLTGAKANLQGSLTGVIDYRSTDQIPVFIASLAIDSFSFNRQQLGNTLLEANWNDEEGSIRLDLVSEMEGQHVVEAKGDYTPREELVDFEIRLREFQLAALNAYTGNIASDLNGTADVDLTLDGTLEAPELNGSIAFHEGAATLGFLNTRYLFNDRIRIYHNNLYLEDFQVEDIYGNRAMINGSIANSHMKDVYLSLNIDADQFQCMHTQAIDNEVFYGDVFATGNLRLTGSPNRIRLEIQAKTERNTELFLPLYNASEVASSDFLTFIREQEVAFEPVSATSTRIQGMELDLKVDVTTDAVVQLIFDPKVGDIIETSGNGDLHITLDQNNGFRMFGDVVLEQGDYLFTLQNVINKRFKIEPGGKISFNGSPTEASIELEAIYATRAAPYNLYPDVDETKESLKKRIPVECHLLLEGSLKTPTIATGISMPTADAETRNLLENSTSTDEELMKQFLSLLVINNFYSVSGYGSQDMGTPGSIAGVTASELLSNQLSNWLSQISDDFDIGVNYRPGDQITSDQVEVALSTQLLDDRVIISGNLDVGGQETNPTAGTSSNPYIMGDFDVEFRVTDNVSIIAFNRARDELLFETAPYKQGVGISYREEFNNLGQLMNRYREGISNRRKKRVKNKSGDGSLE